MDTYCAGEQGKGAIVFRYRLEGQLPDSLRTTLSMIFLKPSARHLLSICVDCCCLREGRR